MKHNRWLIILVSILLFINVAVFALLRFGKADEYVLTLLKDVLYKALKAEFDVGHFSINDKQIFIDDISLKANDGTFDIKVEKINIDFNLFYALQYKRQHINTIPSVRIYNPVVDLYIYETPDDTLQIKVKKPPSEDYIIDKIRKYMSINTYIFAKRFNLYNGKVNLTLDLDAIKYSTEVNNINITLQNEDNKTKGNISITDPDNLMLDVMIDKPVGTLPNVQVGIGHLPVRALQIADVGVVNAYMEIGVNAGQIMNYHIALKDIEFMLLENYFTALMDSLIILGGEEKLYIESSDIYTRNGAQFCADGVLTTLAGSVTQPFIPKQTNFIINVIAHNIAIPVDYFPPTNTVTTMTSSLSNTNKAIVNILAEGSYKEIALNTKISAPLLHFTMPLDSVRTINEDIKGFELLIKSEDALSKEIDIDLTIDEILGTQLRLTGVASPVLPSFFPFNAKVSLYADKLDLQLPVANSQLPVVMGVNPAPSSPNTEHQTPTNDADQEDTPRRRRRRDTETQHTVAQPTHQIVDYTKASIETQLDFTLIDKHHSQLLADILLHSIDIGYSGFTLTGDKIQINADAQAKDFKELTGDVSLAMSLYDDKVSGNARVDLSKIPSSGDFQSPPSSGDFQSPPPTNLLSLPNASIQLEIHRLFLNQINHTFPAMQASSNINLSNDDDELKTRVIFNVGDDFVKDNFYKGDVELSYDWQADSLDCQIHIFDTTINYTPFTAMIKATGDQTSIKSEYLNINGMIDGEFYWNYKWGKQTQDTPEQTLQLALSADSLSISDICLYFMNPNEAAGISGMLSFDVSYDSSVEALQIIPPPPLPILPQRYPLLFDVSVSDFLLPPLKPVNLSISGNGNLDDIRVRQVSVIIDSFMVLYARANILDFGKEVNLKGRLATQLENILDIAGLSGYVKSDIDYQLKDQQTTAHIRLDSNTIHYNDQAIANVRLDVTQLDEKLQINKAEINGGGDLKIDIFGALNYNLLTDKLFTNTDTIKVLITGNPVRYAQNFVDFIESGGSTLFSEFYLLLDEDGLQFPKGTISLSDTWMNISSQTQPVQNVQLYANIENNRFHLENFRAALGRGSLHIRNEINDHAQNIEIANLNLGNFFIRTSDTGFQIHIPDLMTAGTAANVIIRGRNSREMTISGPIDDMHIIGDVEIANLNAIFPPGATNLLRMVNFIRNEVRAPDTPSAPPPELPLNLDLNVLIGRNNRYVTYPMNIVLTPGGFAHLKYNGKDFILSQAEILAAEGNVELFGTFLTLESAEVRMSLVEDLPNLNVLFYKKVADGTTITLTIYTDRSAGETLGERLKFELASDNSEDTSVIQILTKLRYGKTPDQLSDSQNSSLLQDEAIQIVGLSVGESLLDPIISPIENRFRRLFRLDNISINPGFVQNMISNKVWSGRNESNDAMQNFGSSILLNNLTFTLGRYVHKNVFLEYEMLFQESTDLQESTKIYMYQTYGVRYDLPWKLKIRYSFLLNPAREKNAHEVFLMRSFRFW